MHLPCINISTFVTFVWGSSSESNKLQVFKLQKRACKINLDYNVDDSVAYALK